MNIWGGFGGTSTLFQQNKNDCIKQVSFGLGFIFQKNTFSCMSFVIKYSASYLLTKEEHVFSYIFKWWSKGTVRIKCHWTCWRPFLGDVSQLPAPFLQDIHVHYIKYDVLVLLLLEASIRFSSSPALPCLLTPPPLAPFVPLSSPLSLVQRTLSFIFLFFNDHYLCFFMNFYRIISVCLLSLIR